MSANIVKLFEDKFSEHLEMYENRQEILLNILAKEIEKLNFKVEYLEQRVKNLEKNS